MNIRVVRDKCIGAAACVVLAEEVFELDEDNIAIIRNPKGADDDTILEAAKACPTFAIILEDDATGEQIFPLPSDQ